MDQIFSAVLNYFYCCTFDDTRMKKTCVWHLFNILIASGVVAEGQEQLPLPKFWVVGKSFCRKLLVQKCKIRGWNPPPHFGKI